MRPQAAATSAGTRPRVAVLRAADRANELAWALDEVGAAPVLCPLIDHELPAPGRDRDEALAALGRLAEGGFAWVVFTSVSAVRAVWELPALAARAASGAAEAVGPAAMGPGTMMPDLQAPAVTEAPSAPRVAASTRVAAVGPATADALHALGLPVHLMPPDQHSAQGLLEVFPAVSDTAFAAVLLPAADLASPALADGLLERGWRPQRVSAYRTVDAPAAADLALTLPVPGRESLDPPSGTETLPPADLAAALAAGTLDAAVLTSPSTARRVVRLLHGRRARTGFIAIGRRTAAEATELGLRVDAVARTTDPAGLAAALAERDPAPTKGREA